MTITAEEIETATMMVQILEQRVERAIAARRAELAKVINLRSKDHLFWYVSEGGNIQILQDAAFVATGIHVVGQQLLGVQLKLSLQNGWPRREATQTQNMPVFPSPANQNTLPSQVAVSVPSDHFMPALDTNTAVGIYPPNVDYWYQPIAEWLIPRGDTVAIVFDTTNIDFDLTVVLSGRKVYG